MSAIMSTIILPLFVIQNAAALGVVLPGLRDELGALDLGPALLAVDVAAHAHDVQLTGFCHCHH